MRMREHRSQRAKVGRECVIVGIAQPLAITASRHVGTENAKAIDERRGERVEVLTVACEAVHAHDHVRIVGFTPFTIDHAVEAVETEVQKAVLAWRSHGPVRMRGCLWRAIVKEKITRRLRRRLRVRTHAACAPESSASPRLRQSSVAAKASPVFETRQAAPPIS